jgi:hypothetical protein
MYPAAIGSTMASITSAAAPLVSYFAAACLFVVAGCRPSEADQHVMVDGGGTGRADSSVDAIRNASELPDSLDAGAADGDVMCDASATADAAVDGAEPPHDDAGHLPFDGGVEDASDGDGGVEDVGDGAATSGTEFSRIVDWSVRKRLATTTGADIVLEEALVSLASVSPTPSRLVILDMGGAAVRSWSAPRETYISDFCVHPSGAASVVLLDRNGNVSLVRLNQDLAALGTLAVHDARVASDPHVSDAGALDLVANRLSEDAARIGGVGEDVVATVFTSWNSVIAYRASFSAVASAWAEPQRTLVEPPSPLTPNLPIGGSFDTFGAMTAWFRALLDVDEDGNTYVAVWASPRRIRDHVSVFADDLSPLPVDPNASSGRDADVLLTKLDRDGARLWSRVLGTANEDEPYALCARNGTAAVVGRARRSPGFDNTFWDVFIAVTSSSGASRGARTIALDNSSIALAVDSLPKDGWVLGGSDHWTQNPDGLSIVSFGAKLLLELPSLAAEPIRLPLPSGPRHNEIRTVRVSGSRFAFGGHEDGPITHTGDADVGQIRSTGVLGTALDSRGNEQLMKYPTQVEHGARL